MGRTKGECRRIRRSLQDLHDAGSRPSGHVAEHVSHCGSCAAFQSFLEALPSDLKDTLERSVDGLPAPDYAALRPPAPHKRLPSLRRFGIPAIAAAFVAVAVPSLVVTISVVRERAATQKTVEDFVDELFVFQSGPAAHPSQKASSASSQALDTLMEELAD